MDNLSKRQVINQTPTENTAALLSTVAGPAAYRKIGPPALLRSATAKGRRLQGSRLH